MSKSINIEDLNKFSKEYNKSKSNKIMSNIVRKNGVLACAYDFDEASKIQNIFNVEVKDMPSITNQKQSGRCWMFSGINVLRQIICKNLSIKDIDLSFTYLFFYDKLEKANMLYERAIELIDLSKESREWQFLISNGAEQDGGWWHQFKDLVKKYGICPMQAQQEVYSSTSSAEMDSVLKLLQVKHVDILRSLRSNGASIDELREKKSELLAEVYKVLAICLGEPVDKFTYSYKKDNDETKTQETITLKSTPKEFFEKFVSVDLDDYVSLVNYPSNEHKYYQKYLNIGAQAQHQEEYFSLNLPIKELKDAAIKSLKDNNAMWFACDVSSSSFRKDGILSTEVYSINKVFKINFEMDKYERLRYFASSCNHAMTLTGVNLTKSGKPNRWKIQNSWGVENGFQGIYIMTDKWFTEYVYNVVVNKKYLSDKAKEALNSNVITLDPWEPLA